MLFKTKRAAKATTFGPLDGAFTLTKIKGRKSTYDHHQGTNQGSCSTVTIV